MIKHNQDGAASSILIIASLTALLIVALIFGISSYSGKQHYKNDTESLINAAVSKAVAQESALKDSQFAQQEKDPLNTYNGPQDYGSVVVKYPKTWSGYVDSSGNNNNVFAAYFNPGTVPTVSDQASVFALTVQVVNQAYSQVLQGFQQQSGVTSSAYALPKLPKIVGVELSGPISQNQTNETMVVLPIRSNTLEIATDGTQYLNDFNSIILANLSFSP